ncbi:hypothetical protein [Deinococcus roseus]|uniref:Uncharacterized protein n=1 Tax=Deinococcus roseus TaxID=392414 RepID=A0ABQ2DCR3_9DEIO|nr:hypothetical protein [Deinococcus roseus]GGJ53322.1 hypothetical protein GCM10008938_44170 [Deinococcus roseus]
MSNNPERAKHKPKKPRGILGRIFDFFSRIVSFVVQLFIHIP